MRRALAVLVFAGVTLAGLATPALAHNELIDSTPKDGATVEQGPARIELKFDQPVQEGPDLNTMVILGPQQDRWDNCGITVKGTTVSVPVRPLGPAGTYTVNWRVLSADGHPVQGQLKFTLSRAGAGTATTADELAKCAPGGAVAQPAANADQGGGDGGVPAWVWIAGAAVLLVLGVVLALRMGGREENNE